jgi:hypothetical protein
MQRARSLALLCGCALLGSLLGCSRPQETASAPAAPAPPAQRSFASPDEAGAALLAAAQSADEAALLAIFGPDSKDVLFTGDAVKDKDNLQGFVAAYNQMHRWREIRAGGEMLTLGADNQIFPIPLAQTAPGKWEFDTAAGKDEILARRIGRDELVAIAACSAIAKAQQKYFSTAHDGAKVKQYAQKLVSDPGKQDGLFWPSAAGQPASPLADLGELAKTLGYADSGAKPQPFNGYYYQILTKQGPLAKGGEKNYVVDGKMTGGFAVLAYPAEYRASGIMTFVVGADGTVYQKDLGEATRTAAPALTAYDPGDGWTPAL